MALSKKGSRRVIVDGEQYTWKVRRRPTYDQGLAHGPLTFTAEKSGATGSILVVDTKAARPDNWVLAPSMTITPAYVAESIREAIKRGWLAEQKSSPFNLEFSIKEFFDNESSLGCFQKESPK